MQRPYRVSPHGATARASRIVLDDVLRTVVDSPTLAECYDVAALDAANRPAR